MCLCCFPSFTPPSFMEHLLCARHPLSIKLPVNWASGLIGEIGTGNTHDTLGASDRHRSTASQKEILFCDDQGRLLSPRPPSFHICSLIYLKRYLSTMRRPPFHASDPSRTLAPPAIDMWPSWAAGTQPTQLPTRAFSSSKTPLNLLRWCWAQPCCFLPPS